MRNSFTILVGKLERKDLRIFRCKQEEDIKIYRKEIPYRNMK
jgi:hypothetical protein